MTTSDLQIQYLAGGQLKVVVPPYTLMFLVFAFGAAIPVGIAAYRAIRMRSFTPFILVPIFALPFFLVALSCRRGGSVTLDRAADIATVVQPTYLWSKTGTLPLHDVQYAQLYFGRGSSHVVLVLRDGSAVGFSDSTTQGGQGEAVQAINDYLGVHVQHQ